MAMMLMVNNNRNKQLTTKNYLNSQIQHSMFEPSQVQHWTLTIWTNTTLNDGSVVKIEILVWVSWTFPNVQMKQ